MPLIGNLVLAHLLLMHLILMHLMLCIWSWFVWGESIRIRFGMSWPTLWFSMPTLCCIAVTIVDIVLFDLMKPAVNSLSFYLFSLKSFFILKSKSSRDTCNNWLSLLTFTATFLSFRFFNIFFTSFLRSVAALFTLLSSLFAVVTFIFPLL